MVGDEFGEGKRPWPSYVLVYVMWLVTLALGIWLLLVSRDAIIGVASVIFAQPTSASRWRVSAVEKYYALGAGFVWLALMVFSELYFRNGVRRGQLIPRIARIVGIELLALFVFDAILFVTQGMPSDAWTRWLLLFAELASSVACLVIARPAPRLISDIKVGDAD